MLYYIHKLCGLNHWSAGNRGTCKAELGDYRGAIIDFNKSIEIYPYDEGVLSDRGICKNELKDYSGALRDFNRAIDFNSKFGVAYLGRGLSKLKLKQKDSACMDWSIAGSLGVETAYLAIKKYCNEWL